MEARRISRTLYYAFAVCGEKPRMQSLATGYGCMKQRGCVADAGSIPASSTTCAPAAVHS